MDTGFQNVYNDAVRAEAYAQLEFPGTYYLAYRDLPAIIRQHAPGTRAVDFGCGTGRSTRFLRDQGFRPIGVDISEPMLAQARDRDPGGDYRLVPDGDLSVLASASADLILAAFTFDNVPTHDKKVRLFAALRRLLVPTGRIVTVVSAPEIYWHEWASFSTKQFPENRTIPCGGPVRITMLDVPDARPVEDILWTPEGYQVVHTEAGLQPVAIFHPLGDPTEPYPWVSETRIAPWAIYVLAPAE